jgi:hypothetical protein
MERECPGEEVKKAKAEAKAKERIRKKEIKT